MADVATADASTTDVATTDVGAPTDRQPPADTGAVVDASTAEDTMTMAECPAGQQRCGETCLDTATDARHCGACGTVCPSIAGGSATCAAGACGVTCAAGRTMCQVNATTVCADVMTDAAHCGACGTACGTDEACRAGQCVFECSAPRQMCGTGDSAVCTNIATDPLHCGACGMACPTFFGLAAICVRGACDYIRSCPAGTVMCTPSDLACRNVASDIYACGGCGNQCPAPLGEGTPTCTNGVCNDCGPGAMNCGGRCRIVRNDNGNCGACNRACAPTEYCDVDRCVARPVGPTCPPPSLMCGETCLNPATNRAHCGACGNACRDDQACVAGACGPGSYRVFVTSTLQTPGGLGGLAGADRVCQTRANAANLGGTWMAWVSTRTASPRTRFTTRALVPYRTVTGVTIANNWNELWADLRAPINITELGTRATHRPAEGTIGSITLHPGEGAAVFTGTQDSGHANTFSPFTGNTNTLCADLTNERAPDNVLIGSYTATEYPPRTYWFHPWTGYTEIRTSTNRGEYACATPLALYCFEQ
ncbi:MAG: hypothetical protein IPF99_30085 [Deltaproteobacteria bacterium]|jgi:hypothetical protein|nr:hypothetical protein [Deltaproteobacteria bacterium]